MNDIEAIDAVLADMNRGKIALTRQAILNELEKKSGIRSDVLLSIMMSEQLLEDVCINGFPEGSLLKLTDRAKIIMHQQGGYIGYYQKVLNERGSKAIREDLELKKLKNEVILTKWQYWFFWIGSILGGLGFIIQLLSWLMPNK